MTASRADPTPTDADLAACRDVLRALSERPPLCSPDDPRVAEIASLAGRVLRHIKDHQKREAKRRDQELLDATGIRRGRADRAGESVPAAAAPETDLSRARRCYVCKRPYQQLHVFYDWLCPACGDAHFAKREQTADLTGRTALITGGRVKIGFETALKLLRCGATVLATTRFPRDAAARYAQQPDFADWSDRLHVCGIDLRHLPSVERLADAVCAEHPGLDVVINNAAQTVRRPPAFFKHLLDAERSADLPAPARRLIAWRESADAAPTLPAVPAALPLSAALSQVPLLPGDAFHDPLLFPPGAYDADRQQLDLRPVNSWALSLGEVTAVELLEAHAVNCFAPFLLLRRLEPLLFRDTGRAKYVVNVSATEGQMNCLWKTGKHPHTNMAKAALNMLTRTCAEPYADRRVFMNSVDTGWVTDEAPYPLARRREEDGWQPPLDVTDGAARVCDPIFVGINTGENVFGKLFKDYRPVPW